MKNLTYITLGFMTLLAFPSLASGQGHQRWHVQLDLRESNPLLSNDITRLDMADLNQDGVPEMLFADPYYSTYFRFLDRGRVSVVDGATGHVLFEQFGAQSNANFGLYAHFLEDISGDGIPDLAISDGQLGTYRLHLFSGADFQALNNPEVDRRFHDVISIGDQTGDGLSELAVIRSTTTVPTLDILDGFDFSLIARKDLGDFPVLTRLGDLNGDGFDDVGLTYILRPLGLDQSAIMSGTDLLPISNFTPDLYGAQALADAGDVDGDGIDDVIVGEPHKIFPMRFLAGQATIYSGADGAVIARHVGLTGEQVGRYVEGLGDVDHDGFADYMIGSRASRLRSVARDNYLELRFFSGANHSEQGIVRGFGPIGRGVKIISAYPATQTQGPFLAFSDPINHPSGSMTSRVFMFRHGN